MQIRGSAFLRAFVIFVVETSERCTRQAIDLAADRRLRRCRSLYRGSANTYTALAPLAVSASGVTTVCVAAIGPPPDVMAMN